MQLNPFQYHAPNTTGQASGLYGDLENSQILSGGTFLINTLKTLKKRGLKSPDHIISLRKIPELKEISVKKDTITIGSAVTLNEIIDSKDLSKACPVLLSVAKNIGTTQIRNMATIGGNLVCHYTWTEFPACLIALNADLIFLDKAGKEKIISSEEFFANNAKTSNLLTKISIKTQAKDIAVYKRVSRRTEVDLPMLSICIKANIAGKKISDARVAINSGAGFAKRSQCLENFLNKQQCIKGLGEKAVKDFDTSAHGANLDEYKKTILIVSIKNIIEDLIK